MRLQSKRRRWRFAEAVTLLVMTAALSSAGAQNRGSQVLRLPDPTPRDIPPELRFPSNTATLLLGQKMTAAQNEKRWHLILWATGEMVVLSERAEKAALEPTGDASRKDLEGNLIKIDVLAKNLSAALKAH